MRPKFRVFATYLVSGVSPFLARLSQALEVARCFSLRCWTAEYFNELGLLVKVAPVESATARAKAPRYLRFCPNNLFRGVTIFVASGLPGKTMCQSIVQTHGQLMGLQMFFGCANRVGAKVENGCG